MISISNRVLAAEEVCGQNIASHNTSPGGALLFTFSASFLLFFFLLVILVHLFSAILSLALRERGLRCCSSSSG